MTTNDEQRTTNKIIWIIFAIIIVAVYFFGLTIPLVGPDEPRYSQVAREMFERGDWVTPTLGGFDWFEKPALLYWLQIASYKLFGVTEFAARFGSALFGLGTILSLWILGKNYPQINTDKHGSENQRPKTKDQRPKTDFANWLALIAASSIGLIVFSRGASFDIILTFPITASLVAFFIFDQSEKKSFTTYYLPLTIFYFFIGVALIAKGLVGAVFPLAIVAFYYLLQWKFPSKTFLVSLVWGIILSLLVASIWYLPMYQVNGWKFVDEFFIQHHFQRYTSNKYQHPQPFYFFFWVLPLMTIPWLPFFFIAIWKPIKNLIGKFKGQETKTELTAHISQLATFAWAWLLVPLVFFSLSGSKLPGYILPALPAALILTALYIYEFAQKSQMRKILVQLTAFSTFLIVTVLAQFFVHDFVHTETVKHLVDTANANGYKTEKIVNMHTISHSVEFYGAGRLVREADGKQKRFYGTSQILDLMKEDNSERVLVLIPLEFLYTIKDTDEVETQILDDNGELAIVLVKKKTSTLSRSSEPIHQS
jgi:4-amino-4-deoxy-L-arabinose transferase-like glycosyltransferase